MKFIFWIFMIDMISCQYKALRELLDFTNLTTVSKYGPFIWIDQQTRNNFCQIYKDGIFLDFKSTYNQGGFQQIDQITFEKTDSIKDEDIRKKFTFQDADKDYMTEQLFNNLWQVLNDPAIDQSTKNLFKKTITLDDRYMIGEDVASLKRNQKVEYDLFFNLCNADVEMPETLKDALKYEQCEEIVSSTSESNIEMHSVAILIAKDIKKVANDFKCLSLSIQHAESTYTENVLKDQFGNSVKTVNQDDAIMSKMQNQIHYAPGNICNREIVYDLESISEMKIRFKLIQTPVCAYHSMEQLKQQYVVQNSDCEFEIVNFLACQKKFHEHLDFFSDDYSPEDYPIMKEPAFIEHHVSQYDRVLACFIWLDLIVNRYIIGLGSISLGLVFSCTNFQWTNKKQRYCVINLISCIVSIACVVVPVYFFYLADDINAIKGWLCILIGLLIGQIFALISIFCSIRFFCLQLGFLTGFCLANTLQINILYQVNELYYLIAFGSIAIIFAILAQIFHYNIYNWMLSFCGAFFITRGIVIMIWNDQISMIKHFLWEKNFRQDHDALQNTDFDILHVMRPVYQTIAMCIIWLISMYFKQKLIEQTFKQERHAYYQIN